MIRLALFLAFASLADRESSSGQPGIGTLSTADPPLAGHGASERWSFESTASERVTITLRSHDFDAFLRVEKESGELVAEDDDGGIEHDARVRVDAVSGTRFVVIAAADEDEGSGEYVLGVEKGDLPVPAGVERLEAGLEWRSAALERALARGDSASAEKHAVSPGRAAREGAVCRPVPALQRGGSAPDGESRAARRRRLAGRPRGHRATSVLPVPADGG